MIPRSPTHIEEVVRSLVAQRLKIDPSNVPMDVPIVAELGLESIEVMQFLLDIEDHFPPFCLTDSTASELRTLHELVENVERATRGPEPPPRLAASEGE
jgi:acyl carrier protein